MDWRIEYPVQFDKAPVLVILVFVTAALGDLNHDIDHVGNVGPGWELVQ
jgi:hypothetical protein